MPDFLLGGKGGARVGQKPEDKRALDECMEDNWGARPGLGPAGGSVCGKDYAALRIRAWRAATALNLNYSSRRSTSIQLYQSNFNIKVELISTYKHIHKTNIVLAPNLRKNKFGWSKKFTITAAEIRHSRKKCTWIMAHVHKIRHGGGRRVQ